MSCSCLQDELIWLPQRGCAFQPRVATKSLPWDCGLPHSLQPQRGCGMFDDKRSNPFRVVCLLERNRPRVAAARQPWAGGRNAVGVWKTAADGPNDFCHGLLGLVQEQGEWLIRQTAKPAGQLNQVTDHVVPARSLFLHRTHSDAWLCGLNCAVAHSSRTTARTEVRGSSCGRPDLTRHT